MLCSFLLYSKVNQLYVYIYPLLWTSFPFRSPHSAEKSSLSYSRFSLVIYFIHNSVYMSMSISQFISPTAPLLVSICLFSTSACGTILTKDLYREISTKNTLSFAHPESSSSESSSYLAPDLGLYHWPS